MLEALKREYWNVLICTGLCKLLVRCFKLFIFQICEICAILYSILSRCMIISVLKDCAILLEDLLHQVFVDVYRRCQARDGNCCYEISNMLFLVITSLCFVCVCVCVCCVCVCVCSSGVNKRCSVGYVCTSNVQ